MKKFLFLLLLSLPAAAQNPGGDDPSPGGPGGTPADPTGVPIDGGASLLLAGGVAYGLRRLRQARAGRRG